MLVNKWLPYICGEGVYDCPRASSAGRRNEPQISGYPERAFADLSAENVQLAIEITNKIASNLVLPLI